VIRDHELVLEVPLQGPMRIGRRDDNDLVLHDESVSGHHGLIDRDEHGWRYTDLGAVNGSIVAAGPTLRAKQSVALLDDTQILLGSTVLDVRIEPSEASTKTTMPIRRTGAPAPPARLVILVDGMRHTVALSGPVALIGRADECDVQLRNSSVSSRHAELRWDGQQWTLRDLNSTNGTRVGVHKITAPRPIGNNTQILVGDADLLFVHDGQEPDAATDAVGALAALRRERVLSRSRAREAERELQQGHRQLGEILVAAGWVSPGQWVEALTEAAAPADAPESRSRQARLWLLGLVVAALATAAWMMIS